MTTAPVLSCVSEDITDASIYTGSKDTLTTTWKYWEDDKATIPLATPTAITTAGTYYVTNTGDGIGCTDTASITLAFDIDTDGDGYCNFDDLNDNDGILDVDEYGYADFANFLWSMNNSANKNEGNTNGLAYFAETPLPDQTFGSGTITTPVMLWW